MWALYTSTVTKVPISGQILTHLEMKFEKYRAAREIYLLVSLVAMIPAGAQNHNFTRSHGMMSYSMDINHEGDASPTFEEGA